MKASDLADTLRTECRWLLFEGRCPADNAPEALCYFSVKSGFMPPFSYMLRRPLLSPSRI